MEETVAKKRGFAGMNPEDRQRICSMGGKAAHEKGTAHKFTSEEARLAGKIGGMRSGEARRRNKGAKNV